MAQLQATNKQLARENALLHKQQQQQQQQQRVVTSNGTSLPRSRSASVAGVSSMILPATPPTAPYHSILLKPNSSPIDEPSQSLDNDHSVPHEQPRKSIDLSTPFRKLRQELDTVMIENEDLSFQKQELTRTILILRKTNAQLQSENDESQRRILAAEEKIERLSCVLDRYPSRRCIPIHFSHW